MERRTFIGTLAGGLLAAPLAAEAQRARPPHRVVVLTLNPRSSGPAAAMLDSLRQGFRDLGYREGENLVLEEWFADGDRVRLAALAGELLKVQPAVIVTFGTPATVAARNATIRHCRSYSSVLGILSARDSLRVSPDPAAT